VRFAVNSWSSSLEESKIDAWIQPYMKGLLSDRKTGTVAIVMAGNIPFVGLHDLLCAIVSGHRIIARTASGDAGLTSGVVGLIRSFNPGIAETIRITDERIEKFDAVIATGSNNTSRYFEYYFGKYPHIIRKNRNGVAVLTGTESRFDHNRLASDIFTYFGLGCRNVSKVFVPGNFDFERFLADLEDYREITDHHKYLNNYDYQKSILMINMVHHYDNGFLLMKENESFISPISVLNYEFYNEVQDLRQHLITKKDHIQCIVAQDGLIPGAVMFGESQKPELWDYADEVDTLSFLLTL
jgi:hypothetical protein